MKNLSLAIFALALPLLLCGCGGLPAPLDHASSHPAALRFGMHVTPDPATNPIIPPEEFSGYHAALDLEILPGEADKAVTVYAICNGTIAYSGFAEGYGGLVAEHCSIKSEKDTVIYGHLDKDGLIANGTVVEAGDILGNLAPAKSEWSGGNRKHLHLGIRKGETSDYRGYVQTEEELKDYIDPRTVLGTFSAGKDVTKFTVEQ